MWISERLRFFQFPISTKYVVFFEKSNTLNCILVTKRESPKPIFGFGLFLCKERRNMETNVKELYIAQLNAVNAIVQDIIKQRASMDVLIHAANVCSIDAPFFFKGREEENDTAIRVNIGEVYAYIDLAPVNDKMPINREDFLLTGEVYWDLDEIGVPIKEQLNYQRALNFLTHVEEEDLRPVATYFDCYEERDIDKMRYKPYKKGKYSSCIY